MKTASVLRAALFAPALSAALLFAAPAQAVPSCGGQTHQNVCGSSNIYPCCYPSNGNCTWWAWEAACRSWHVGFSNWGNANTWAKNAALNPLVDVIGYPLPGSIATSTKGGFGHVAWVESVNGGSVVVSQEACHSNGAPGGYNVASSSTAYFNSGFVVLHGAACSCADGDKQTEACSCGTRSRTCNACAWGDWGTCKGPPEVCDGVDNDCNGEVDEGHPQEFGPTLPDYAATLVDVSYPQMLVRGARGTIWADFRNSGAKPWTKDSIWLTARGAAADEPVSALASTTWPAWNVASQLQGSILPGEIGRFAFEVAAPDQEGVEITETFQLQVPGGDFLVCPAAEITPKIWVMSAESGNGGAGGNGSGGNGGAAPADTNPSASVGGCSHAPGGGAPAGGAALALALVALARSRRAVSPGRRASGR